MHVENQPVLSRRDAVGQIFFISWRTFVARFFDISAVFYPQVALANTSEDNAAAAQLVGTMLLATVAFRQFPFALNSLLKADAPAKQNQTYYNQVQLYNIAASFVCVVLLSASKPILLGLNQEASLVNIVNEFMFYARFSPVFMLFARTDQQTIFSLVGTNGLGQSTRSCGHIKSENIPMLISGFGLAVGIAIATLTTKDYLNVSLAKGLGLAYMLSVAVPFLIYKVLFLVKRPLGARESIQHQTFCEKVAAYFPYNAKAMKKVMPLGLSIVAQVGLETLFPSVQNLIVSHLGTNALALFQMHTAVFSIIIVSFLGFETGVTISAHQNVENGIQTVKRIISIGALLALAGDAICYIPFFVAPRASFSYFSAAADKLSMSELRLAAAAGMAWGVISAAGDALTMGLRGIKDVNYAVASRFVTLWLVAIPATAISVVKLNGSVSSVIGINIFTAIVYLSLLSYRLKSRQQHHLEESSGSTESFCSKVRRCCGLFDSGHNSSAVALPMGDLPSSSRSTTFAQH